MFRLGNQFTIGLVFVRRSSLDNHLRGSLVHGAFASQKPSSGTCFACRKSGPWRVSCPLYQHSSSAAGKQWLPQDGFEGVVFSCIYCLSRCASCTFTYTLFRFAILQIPNLLMRQSLTWMCVIKKKNLIEHTNLSQETLCLVSLRVA